MAELVWYRSLYWRIALGVVALVATVLALQVAVFLWMTGRMADLFPNRSPAQFAAAIAGDVSTELAERPGTDLAEFLNNGRFSRSSRGFVVAMSDGRTILSERVPPPAGFDRMARARLFFFGRAPGDNEDDSRGFGDGPRRGGRSGSFGRGSGGPTGRGPGGSGGRGADRASGDAFGRGFGGPPGFRGGPSDRSLGPSQPEFSEVMLNGAVVGMVAVPRDPPPWTAALRDSGPTLAGVALVLLVGGTAVAALLIFRPTRRRLQELQEAARGIGAGQLDVRAPESGGDEVTALSRVFNEMAAQLEQRTEALEAADRTRRQLLADVSHELTTPLAAILGYVETLRMPDIAIDERTRNRYLRIVNDEADRLEHIIGDLLDLARLEGGGGSLRQESVSVAHLLERVRHRHAPIVAEKKITLTTRQEPMVDMLVGDQNRLEQALQNLVANAVRHTPSGGSVTVTAVTDGPVIMLRVEDTGPGIPPDQLRRVFDRFYKVDESRTGTDAPSGSGLGLSIVQAIVTRHGGAVTVANAPGGGARFEISLPAAGSTAPGLSHTSA